MKTKKFKINNYGMKNINWLINEFKNKEISKSNIEHLKSVVYDSFINNSYIDFSTKGNVSVTIVDLENMTNCEIIYN